uniref:Lysosomal trafficking regulator n=1 Tax=Paramormyrops kingsleyae TaxID=1676925 RepID=A0A3B3QSJ6_9TELE
MSGASNTLAREFLTDVHQLCSAVAQRVEEDEENQSHMAALGEYLVLGRGFLLLSTLDSVIDQELTCREELLTLLLSLLPLVWKIPVQEDKAGDFSLPLLPDIVAVRDGAAIPTRPGQERGGTEKRPAVDCKSRRQRRTAQRYSVRDARKSQLSTSDSDANSDDKAAGLGGRYRRSHGPSLLASCQLHPLDPPGRPLSPPLAPPTADTMNSIEVGGELVPRLFGVRPVDPEPLSEPTALSIFNRMENSPFDLCHVLLSLLEKVCRFDMSLNHSPALAASVVPTLSEILAEFGDCCGPGGVRGGAEDLAEGWTEEPVALVQRMLLRTILHLMSVDVGQGETLPDSLRRNLTDLLRATLKIRGCLEKQADPFAPRPKKTLLEVREDFSFSRYRHRVLLLPELLEGVLQVLLGCLQASAPNPFFLSQAMELVHEFVQHRGLELFEAAVLQLEALRGRDDTPGSAEAAARARQLVGGVMRIISAVKKAKSEQLHQSVCARRRHRRCEYSHFLHHHRDLSGLPVSAFKQAARRNPFEEEPGAAEVHYPDHCCCVAACAHQCLRLLQHLPASATTCLQVLSAVQAVGICCCMDPHSVVTPLLHAFQVPELRGHQSHILTILSRLLLEQLGGGRPLERTRLASCNICTVDGSQLPGPEEPAGLSLSPSYRSQGILPSGGPEDVLWKWEALEAYRDLAFGEDRARNFLVAGHVCQLLLRGNAAVQWQLYAHVLGPALQRGVELARHARELGVSSACSQACAYHSHCLPVEVLLVYLQTLPVLLKSRVIRDLFLSCNGLNQVTELIWLDSTRPSALKVLETLILTVGEQQADGLMEGPDGRETEGPVDAAGPPEGPWGQIGDGPQSLRQFYEGLREACPPRRRSKGGGGRGRTESLLASVNLFLCVAFLCVSKDADSDRDSTNDSEDTSGYDSTASEPLGGRLPCLSADTMTLPPQEHMRRAADVWMACRRVYLASPTFQRQFCRLGGLEACRKLLAMVTQKLSPKGRDSRARKSCQDEAGRTPQDMHFQVSPEPAPQGPSDPPGFAKDAARKTEDEWPLHCIRLLEALLAICLHSASSALQRLEPDLPFQVPHPFPRKPRSLPRFTSHADKGDFLHLKWVCLIQLDALVPLQKHQSGLEASLPAEDVSEDVDEPPGCDIRPPGEEEGYEADSEDNPEDASDQEEEDGQGLAAAMAAVEGWAGRGALLFPEVCAMELLLLSAGSPELEVLRHVLRGLLGAVRSHPRNAALLYQQGAVKTILGGFQNVLNQTDHSSKGCQVLLMELLVAMLSERITAEELSMLIRLFLEQTPPTEILLRGVLQIVEANMDMEPLHYLSFPLVPGTSTTSVVSPGPKAGVAWGAPASSKSMGLLWRGRLTPGRREAEADGRAGHQLASPWHVAPIHLPLVGQNCWPHMANGFSTSLWLRAHITSRGEGPPEPGYMKRNTGPHVCLSVPEEEPSLGAERLISSRCLDRLVEQGFLHIISLGSKALMLQVWADLSTGAVTFRICMDPNDEMKAGLLAQAESPEGLLVPGKWQHLALSYTQQPEGKKNIHGTVTLWVCGVRKCEVFLDYMLPRKPGLSSDSNKTFCMLGHCLPAPEDVARLGGGWDIGSLLLFNGSRIGPEEAFYLYASGPDLTSIMPCKYGKARVQLSRYVTREGLQCERVRELLMRNRHADTAPLIVVELSDCERTQALVLQVLLSLVKYNQHRLHEMENCHGYAMIHQVLIKSKCIVGYHILKTLLDGCCSGPVLILGEDGQFRLDTESTAVVQDLTLMSEVLLDWKIWSKAQCGVWETLLAALEILIRVHHPQQMFNICQLLNAQVVHRFLLTCQVLQEHKDEHLTSMPQDVCLSFVKIIQEVLGSPPDLELLRLIYSFLLAVHPPTNTYACHTPPSFYFSLHVEGKLYNEKVQSIIFLRYSGSSGRSAASSVLSLSPTPFLEVPPEGTEIQTLHSPQDPVILIETLFAFPVFLPVSPLINECIWEAPLSLHCCRSCPLLDIPCFTVGPVNCLVESSSERGLRCLRLRQSGLLCLWRRSGAEDCLVLVCCGLYDLLRGVLLLLPDLLLEEVMDKLVQPEALVVLVNHPSPLIQQGVMKLLDAYFTRATKEQKEKFLKNHGFSLLANQLYLHQGTQGLLECFLEMLFSRPVGLEEELDLEDLENIAPFRKRCIIPMLGLIENGLCENALVHNALCMLLQLLNACPKMADILLDHGLLYVLFNTLATLHGLENGIPLNDYKLLVCDIQQLMVAVTIHSCSTSGSQYFRIIEDLVTLLGYLQSSKIRRTQEMAVALQFRVLQAAIEFIRTTADQDPQKAGGSAQQAASPPSSPHHLLQKRKSIAGRRRFSLVQSDSLLMRMRSVASDELTHMMQRRMSQENPIRASESEFIQRLQRLVVLAVNRLIYQDVTRDIFDLLNLPETPGHQGAPAGPGETTSEENGAMPVPTSRKSFQKEILKLMMEGIKVGLVSSLGAPRQQWRRILWSCRDTFRVQIGRLLVHALSPTQPLEDRKEALEFVREPSHPDILRESLSPGLEHGPKLALYLYEMLHDHKDSLTKDERSAVGVFMTTLKLCGHRCIPPGAPAKPDLIKAIKEEQLKYEAEESMSRAAWERKMSSTQKSLMQRLDGKLKDISKIAADITQNISLRQGMERKKVIQHIRSLYKVDLSASRHWQELVQQLTHDRAVWHDQASYPTSWQLDATEGPNRERRRLQRCYLTIPNKYLLRDRQKPEERTKPILSFLFEDKTHSSFSSTVKDKATSEAIRFTRKCISVAPSRETAGELLLGKSGMYFVEDNAADSHDSQMLHGETEPASFSWTYEEIKEVHKRWWQLRDNGVEIFLTNGRTLLLAFDNTKFRDDVYQNILTSNLPNLLEYGNITALTHLWASGQITNFEYLTHLNKHAGRSFNDLMQYPVFPFILSDYTNETMDLTDPTIYRNLSKPIAVQSKEKEERYVDNYKYLEEEFRKGACEDDPMPPVQPYHYGSHYSNSGTVLHFLVRMPPFTKMFLAYQDQSFDIPDRTFHSMNTTWRLSSYESMTDVKELIPEFFYLPEFLVNREGFDFGVRQNGDRVNHVNLPPWARSDPRLFILIHRQALESDQVSQTLCQWIDLVFGLKQKGKAAVQAINVFHPATYFGMDVSAVEDPVQRRALETMIKTYGQTPRQLFSSSHASRAGPRLSIDGELPAAVGLLVQLAFRETREQPKEVSGPSPLPWIKGLKWGEYVGSPSAPDPVVCFSQPHGERFGSLLALPTRAVCGLSRKFCLMMIYSKEQGVRSMHSTDIQWSAILSWGYADNMLRLKSKQSEPPVNFIQCSQLHQVTSCAWVPDSCQLFTGSRCGVITAYSNRFTSTTPSEMEVESQMHLFGHTGEVLCLFVCKPYSILISASEDGTCILWDLNRLCHVQNLMGHKSPISAVSASETTGDIATVCDSVGGGSDLRLWTVNGDLIGHVHCREIICSVAFSNQPEGVSVNVIAGGLENGVVRLWSTWDLKPVREITFPKSSKPIVSLTYSCDGHHLYTANSEGTVMAWCRRDQQRLKLPMFYSFLSSYAAG